MRFGDYLATIRKEKGLSLRGLSEKTGHQVDYTYISKLEASDEIMPSEEKVNALADALELTGFERKIFVGLGKMGSVSDPVFEWWVDPNLSPKKTIEDLEMLSTIKARGKHPKTKEEVDKLYRLIIKTLSE